MWMLEVLDLTPLSPTEQLWVIAQAIENHGGSRGYVSALRALAERLEDLGWWLDEPSEARKKDQSGGFSVYRLCITQCIRQCMLPV